MTGIAKRVDTDRVRPMQTQVSVLETTAHGTLSAASVASTNPYEGGDHTRHHEERSEDSDPTSPSKKVCHEDQAEEQCASRGDNPVVAKQQPVDGSYDGWLL